MTQPEQPPKPEEVKVFYTEVQKRMFKYALHHFPRVGPRMRVGLQNLGLLDNTLEPIGEGIEAEVLRAPNHPRREHLPPGPLLLYVTQETPSSRMLVELPILLFSELPEIRKSALACLDHALSAGGLRATPKTRAALARQHDAIMSDTPTVWRPAATAASDAFNNDVLVAMQAVHQALVSQPVLGESLNTYFPKMMFPDFTSLDSIDIGVRRPEAEHALLAGIIAAIVSAACDLEDACERYYHALGFLPLAPPFALAAVVSGWLEKCPDAGVWDQVWRWAHAASSPIPRYHAVTVFVQRPNFIPSEKLVELWDEIIGIVSPSVAEVSDGHEQVSWDLRRDLALHFTRHLEAQMPGNNGAGISVFAWWFAEQVASLFPARGKSARFYHEKWVAPALERSSHVWLCANPSIANSMLRYMTHNLHAPWACSLFALIGSKLDDLKPSELPEDKKATFGSALVTCLISMLPYPVAPPQAPTYAIECNIGESATRWAAIVGGDGRDALSKLATTSQSLGTSEGLCQALRTLDTTSFVDQLAVTMALKAKAFADPAIAKDIWAIVSDREWRRKAMGKAELQVFGMLVEAFTAFLAQHQGAWAWHLPHYLAELAEKEDDEKRLHDIFLYVIYASLSSDTVSAIQRLLQGSKKAILAPWVQAYRDQSDAMYAWYPPWVQGRMRALLASLHVA